MGFMDKAKKLAEQAQSKLDEVQTQFNEKPSASSGPAVEYDKHGRPIPTTPAQAPTPPHGDPVAGAAPPAPPAPQATPTPDASAPPAPAPPAPPTAAPPVPPAPPAAPPSPAGPTAADDPNKPSYEPPKLSSGDPLAG
jgi:hypothetical protein